LAGAATALLTPRASSLPPAPAAPEGLSWERFVAGASKDIVDGPDTLGYLTGEKIAEALARVLLQMAAGKTHINLLAHSRGAMEVILLSHELQRIKDAVAAAGEAIDSSAFEAILFASPDLRTQTALRQVWPALLQVFERTSAVLLPQIKQSLLTVRLHLLLIDPVPGGNHIAGISAGAWRDPRFFIVPAVVQSMGVRLYLQESSRAFKAVEPIAADPTQTQVESVWLPGNHGTGSGNLCYQNGGVVRLADGSVGNVSHVQDLLLCESAEFLERHGVPLTLADVDRIDENPDPCLPGTGIREMVGAVLVAGTAADPVRIPTLRQILEGYIQASSKSAYRLAIYVQIQANMSAYEALRGCCYGGTGPALREQGVHAIAHAVVGRVVGASTNPISSPTRGRFYRVGRHRGVSPVRLVQSSMECFTAQVTQLSVAIAVGDILSAIGPVSPQGSSSASAAAAGCSAGSPHAVPPSPSMQTPAAFWEQVEVLIKQVRRRDCRIAQDQEARLIQFFITYMQALIMPFFGPDLTAETAVEILWRAKVLVMTFAPEVPASTSVEVDAAALEEEKASGFLRLPDDVFGASVAKPLSDRIYEGMLEEVIRPFMRENAARLAQLQEMARGHLKESAAIACLEEKLQVLRMALAEINSAMVIAQNFERITSDPDLAAKVRDINPEFIEKLPNRASLLPVRGAVLEALYALEETQTAAERDAGEGDVVPRVAEESLTEVHAAEAQENRMMIDQKLEVLQESERLARSAIIGAAHAKCLALGRSQEIEASVIHRSAVMEAMTQARREAKAVAETARREVAEAAQRAAHAAHELVAAEMTILMAEEPAARASVRAEAGQGYVHISERYVFQRSEQVARWSIQVLEEAVFLSLTGQYQAGTRAIRQHAFVDALQQGYRKMEADQQEAEAVRERLVAEQAPVRAGKPTRAEPVVLPGAAEAVRQHQLRVQVAAAKQQAAAEKQRLAEQAARLSVLTEEQLARAAIARQGREAVEGLCAQLISAQQRENAELQRRAAEEVVAAERERLAEQQAAEVASASFQRFAAQEAAGRVVAQKRQRNCGIAILSGMAIALVGLIAAAVILAVAMAAWPVAVGVAAGGLVIGAVIWICGVGLYVPLWKPPLPVSGQPSARCAVAPAVDLSEASSPGSVRVAMRVRRDESAPHVPAPAPLVEERRQVASLRSR
jgi:hypothetical protein